MKLIIVSVLVACMGCGEVQIPTNTADIKKWRDDPSGQLKSTGERVFNRQLGNVGTERTHPDITLVTPEAVSAKQLAVETEELSDEIEELKDLIVQKCQGTQEPNKQVSCTISHDEGGFQTVSCPGVGALQLVPKKDDTLIRRVR